MSPENRGSPGRLRLAVVGGGGMSRAHVRALSQRAERASELRELAEVAERAGVIVMPGQTRRFLPEVQWLKARMAADPGLIGNVTNVALQTPSLRDRGHRR